MGVDSHDRAGKIYEFAPFNLAAAIAGSTSSTHAIISELCVYLRGYCKAKMENPKAVMVLEHVRNSLESSRKKELRRIQGCEMESQLGCDLQDWLAGKLPTGEQFNELAHKWGIQILKKVRQDFQAKVGIIVAGVLETGPVFLRGLGFESIEDSASPAIYVIGGKGAVEAMQSLIKRNQNVEMGIARSMLHVYEAMKAAKIDKGVGDPAHYVVMKPWTVSAPHGMLRIIADHPLLKQWSKTYRRRSTEPLETRTANDLINDSLSPSRYRKSRLLGPEELVGKI